VSTLGALVQAGARTYLLGTSHALGGDEMATSPTVVYQPSVEDGGVLTRDAIGSLFQQHSLRDVNTVDCAIARPLDGLAVDPHIVQIGTPRAVMKARMDLIVHKFGRTTGYTVGRVVSVDTDVRVGFGERQLLFRHQIAIESVGDGQFSGPGDSGALIVDRTTQTGVGLLFAGSPSMAFANHLEDVMDALGVRLLDTSLGDGHLSHNQVGNGYLSSPMHERQPIVNRRPPQLFTRLAP
jgi:hypothetical protein